MNFNKAIILGRLTRDPEQKTLPSGQSVVNFGMATNRVFTDAGGNKQEFTEFHNIVAFGKLADICSRYLQKGSLTLVEGRIQTRSWQDQNGVKRNRTEIVIENMQLGPKAAGATPKAAPAPKATEEDIPVIDQEAPIDTLEEKEEEEEEGVNVDKIPF